MLYNLAMSKKNEILKIINSAAAQLSSAQLSSAQLRHHFKLFSSLCLLINYKNYYIYFEFIFDKIVYSIKLLYNENNGFQELLSKIHFNLKSRRYYYVKFLL